MADRNPERDRRDNDREYDRDDPYSNEMYYGRNYDYNRNEFGLENNDWNRGPYSGYGPRGYARPDNKIRDDINDRLTWDGRIDASDISVIVTAGTVVLSGSVDSRQDKRVAEDIADSVSGVWDVHNQLRVRNKGYYRGWQGTGDRDEIRPGMEVVGSQGEHVGTVEEVRNGDFLVGRPGKRNVYVPFAECNVAGGQVQLNVPADKVENQGWMMQEEPR